MNGTNSRARPATKNYAALGRRYAEEVLAGKIAACEFVRNACRRHLEDLERNFEPGAWEYRFDEKRAARVCAFIEKLPHIKGSKWAGRRLELELWQVFALTTIFGWVDQAGRRRFRRAYLEMPKGNGKSALSSGVALYMLCADNEPGAEIYSAATTRQQARIVFDVAQAMARKSPKLCEHFGAEVNAHDISVRSTNSKFSAFSSDANSVEGCNPHLVVFDELHAQPTRELYDNLETAMGKREQNLLWSITTAGNDRAGICYEVRGYTIKVLSRAITDENFFGLVYTVDEGDEWAEPASWVKANPNWGVSVSPDDVGQKAAKALQLASAQPAFLTKHLDVWVGAHSAWLDMVKFLKCADPELAHEDFLGQPCVIGLDLASKLDLLALVSIFWKEISGKLHYYAFGRYWTPEARIEATSNSQYRGWAIDGHLQVVDGETNDYGLVEEYIKELCGTFQVLELAHDPWQAHDTMTRLAQAGVTVVQVPQLPKHLSQPMKDFEAAVYDGRFHYNGDPVLTWAMSNVVCKEDRNGNYFPNKETAENKIDPATALFTAMNGVSRNASLEPAGAGVTVVGNCEKCSALCLGIVEKGIARFRCKDHLK